MLRAQQERACQISGSLNSVQGANLLRADRRGYRYSDLSVDLAFESLMLCGYKGQQFHARTEEGRMPLSRATILRRLQLSCLSPITTVGFSPAIFDNAVRWMRDVHGVDCPFCTICNDATATRSELSAYKAQVLGLATLRQIHVPAELAEFVELINEHGLANMIDVVLLNALDPRVPSYVLGLFPRAARTNADAIQQMWAVAIDELDRRGLYVIACAADGDSAHMSAMKRRRATLLSAAVNELPESLNRFRQAPRDRLFDFAIKELDGTVFMLRTTIRQVALPRGGPVWAPDLHFQDWGHVGSKLRNRLAGRNHHGVRLGDGRAEVGWLVPLVGPEFTAWSGIVLDDLHPKKDPMNVKAAFRLTGERAFVFLEAAKNNGYPQARHLAMYLKLMHHSVRPFSDPDVPLQQCVEWLAWSMYFVRGWRQDAVKKGDAKDEFLTGNQYDCICMNAEEFILLCRWLISLPADAVKDLLLAPRVFGSQQCERFFRLLRALYNDPNFSIEGALHRVNHCLMHEHVAARRSGEFVYAQHRKHLAQESFQRAGLPLPSFTGEDLQRWVEAGRAQALLDLAEVGIIVDNLQQVPPAAGEGGGSAAGELAEDDEDDLRDADSALNEADQDGPAADQPPTAGASQHSVAAAAAAGLDPWRAWSALYPAPVDAGRTSDHPFGAGCFAEPDPAGKGSARVRLQDDSTVSPSKACALAVGERGRLSNDRLTRVKQAKKKRQSPDEAA